MLNKFIFGFLLLPLTFIGCGEDEREQAQQQEYEMQLQQQVVETGEAFRSELSDLLDQYFELKDQLVLSDPEKSAVAADNLIQQAGSIDTGNLNDQTAMLWSSFSDRIIADGNQLTGESDVDEQRIHFEEISETMIHITDTFRPIGYEIFVQSCPMVREGSADWLSREEEIKNPYHGDRMLNCGEVLRRI